MRKYNLKAIHNHSWRRVRHQWAVEDQCESTIWKQFTTPSTACRQSLLLLKTNAKVQFESNSQPRLAPWTMPTGCWRPMRKYNLKAIHNQKPTLASNCSAVEDQCESTIWKQFTTRQAGCHWLGWLLKTNAKVQFESNSQPSSWPSSGGSGCWRPMRKYNLKAIHNAFRRVARCVRAVEDQCESTIWKQFTTLGWGHIQKAVLLKTNAKVQFESNSQHIECVRLGGWCCWRPMRKYNLKAIHN